MDKVMDEHQLMSVIVCDQSDGYLKNWAREQMRESLHLPIKADSGINKLQSNSGTADGQCNRNGEYFHKVT
jgi:hypothetical protein